MEYHKKTQILHRVLDCLNTEVSDSFVGLKDAQIIYMLTRLVDVWVRIPKCEKGNLIIVDSDSKRLRIMREALHMNVENHPSTFEVIRSWNVWGLQRYTSYNDLISSRSLILSSLADESKEIFFVEFSALFQRSSSLNYWRDSTLKVMRGTEYDLEAVILNLREKGYRQVDRVLEVGDFAVRGGILDVKSPAHQKGVRLEFIFDKLEDIRLFDVSGHLSEGGLDVATIPALWDAAFNKDSCKTIAQSVYESLLLQPISPVERQKIVDRILAGDIENMLGLLLPCFFDSKDVALVDFFSEKDIIIYLDSLDVASSRHKTKVQNLWQDWIEDQRAGRYGIDPRSFFQSDDILPSAKSHVHSSISFESIQKIDQLVNESKLDVLPPDIFSSATEKMLDMSRQMWLDYFKCSRASEKYIVILCSQDEHVQRVRNFLSAHSLEFRVFDEDKISRFSFLKSEPGLFVARGLLVEPVWDQSKSLFILPEHILFEEKFKFKVSGKESKPSDLFRRFRELKAGSLVVHRDHGLGRYQGMRAMQVGGVKTDFLLLEYADGDKLYLPVHRLSLLQQFRSSSSQGDDKVSLDLLRGASWSKRKERANRYAKEMAAELTRLYAERRMSKRSPYSPPGSDYFQFEADFPYSETLDQQKAIDEVNADLTRDFPMDRLICGDVGFGKTEVALRAAMRVIQDGYQVVLVAPTSLLSFQHFKTFHGRFSRYGVEVRLINRFEKAKDISVSLEGFSRGAVDVLIGTHRVLSSDVVPYKLGLLIIDEEQRFGVVHKEAIKKIKRDCDVLAMSATPIPRSLHMSLLGIRDISIISTPPSERRSIKTFVAPYDDKIVKLALESELSRGGQAFFVHNRVEDIRQICSSLSALLEGARLDTIHGKMEDSKIEDTLVRFIDRKIDILVCTSIIESGIDIPNVNTIIVNQAERFGLAQLYQMRGRVGRSSRQAFAYFLTESIIEENSDAKRRLDVLLNHEDLGAGFHIASQDLEIRGAGTLLGGEQSGNIEAVGFDTYTELLEKEILEIRGESALADLEPEISLEISASFSSEFIADESDRLTLYKALFSAKKFEDIYRLTRETRDQYGEIPREAKSVFYLAELKIILKRMRVSALKMNSESICELRFAGFTPYLIMSLTRACNDELSFYKLTPDFKLMVLISRDQGDLEKMIELKEKLAPFVL